MVDAVCIYNQIQKWRDIWREGSNLNLINQMRLEKDCVIDLQY